VTNLGPDIPTRPPPASSVAPAPSLPPMSAGTPASSGTRTPWAEANQRCLVAEIARLRKRLIERSLGGAVTDESPHDDALDAELAAARAALPAPAALDVVTEAFGLSRFERELLLLSAAVEMDSGVAAACAGSTARERHGGAVTFGLALAVLDEPHWSALLPFAPLRRWKLLELEAAGAALTASALRIDERILHFLAGLNAIDARLRPLMTPCPPSTVVASLHRVLGGTLADAWAAASLVVGDLPGWPAPHPMIHLHGEDAAGQEDVAAAAAERAGLRLFRLRAEDLPSGAAELDGVATLWEREAVLLSAAFLIRCGDAVPPSVMALGDRLTGPVIVASRDPHRWRRAALAYEVRKPDIAEQRRLWIQVLGPLAAQLNGAIDGASGQFRMSARAIALASAVIGDRVAAGEPAPAAFWRTCRASGRRGLDELAQRITSTARREDLILPAPHMGIIDQIAVHVRQRGRVYDEWGFARRGGARGLGIAALFAGESGTGKTLAAEVLAGELGLDLYRIDLSSVVSKYIGETEKNLRGVFDAAEDSGAVLLFYEADALFGKRSDVKDSHDRYANIEVSYLLQRMEAYRGLAILTTNLKTALDTAFQRRLRFMVTFPFPDEGHREAIWRRVFPPEAPTEALECGRLARLHVTGGAIRNIALSAAFLAAEAGRPVEMKHLLQAAHAESAKTDRPLGGAETRGWV
jgi:hypothetical protein